MTAGADLGTELRRLAYIVGLLDAAGDLDPHWFAEPLATLEGVLTCAGRRQALEELLADVIPGATQNLTLADGSQVDGYPIIPGATVGNIYVTFEEASDGSAIIGVAGNAAGPTGSPIATVSVHAPLIGVADTLTVVAATAAHPLTVDARLLLDWKPPADPFTLEAIGLSARYPLSDGDPGFVVTLHNLDLGQGPVALTTLDPTQLSDEMLRLVGALVGQALTRATGNATGEIAQLTANLPALLGLTGQGPASLLEHLTVDPHAARDWLGALVSDSAQLQAWITAVNGLLGLDGTAVSGSGAEADPWRVALLNGTSSRPAINLTVARRPDPRGGGSFELLVGVTASATGAAATLTASATLLAVPTAGTRPTSILPDAAITVTAPGTGVLLAAPATGGAGVGIGAVTGGVRWDGTRIAGLLELSDVDIDLPAVAASATHFDTLDLSNADALGSAAEQVLTDAVKALVGATTGAAPDARADALLALAGLADTAGVPGGLTVDVTTLVSHPTRAIAEFYRQLLVRSGGDGGRWLTEQLGALLGIAAGVTVSGPGTVDDPWVATWATTDGLAVQLATYDLAAAGAETRQWRIAARAAVTAAPWTAAWTVDLLSVDLAAGAAASPHLLGGQRVSVAIDPIPPLDPVAGVTLSAAAADAALQWAPGQPLTMAVTLSGLSATDQTETATLDTLTLESTDITTGSLGLNADPIELWSLIRLLLAAHIADLGGAWGALLAQLAGLSAGTAALPTLPLLDATDVLSSLSQPAALVRAHLEALLTTVANDGSAMFDVALPALAIILAGASTPTGQTPAVSGGGTREDPWAVSAPGADGNAELLLWLDPDGPPAAARASRTQAVASATGWTAVLAAVDRLRGYLPHLRDALTAVDTTATGAPAGLDRLAQAFVTGDGIVATAAADTATGWSAGQPVTCAHHLLPQHPDAINQITAQLNAWGATNTSDTVIMLIGPTFTDVSSWEKLVAAQSSEPISLRQAGVDPLAVDLSAIKTARFYPIELVDDLSGDPTGQVQQLVRVAATLLALQPTAKQYLVAHSAAGIVACAYAAAGGSTALDGLITLGSPLVPSAVPAITDAGCADAVRLIDRLLPKAFPAPVLTDPVADAITHILGCLDGYATPASAATPGPSAYPLATFAATAQTDFTLANAPLAIPGQLFDAASTPTAMMSWFAARLQALATSAPAHAQPTSLGIGARATLTTSGPGAAGNHAAIVARADLARVTLGANATPAATLARTLSLSARTWSDGDWLASGPGAGLPVDARLRWAELAVTSVDKTATTVSGALHDVGYRGTTAGVVGLDDPRAAYLLSAMWDSLEPGAFATPEPPDADDNGDDTDSPGFVPDWTSNAIVSAFVGAGLATVADDGTASTSADALTALLTDPDAYLAAHAGDALASCGLAAGTDGAETTATAFGSQLAGWPLHVNASLQPLTVGLSTPTDGWKLGLLTTILDLKLQAPTATTAALLQGSATITLGPLTASVTSTPTTVSVAVTPWLASLTVWPEPPAASLRSELAAAAVPALAAATISLAARAGLTKPPLRIAGLADLVHDPGSYLAQLFVAPGGGWDATRAGTFLGALAALSGLQVQPDPPTSTVTVTTTFSGGETLTVIVAPAADGQALTAEIQLSADAVLSVAVTVTVDAKGQVSAGGQLALTVALPNTASLAGTNLTGLAFALGVEAGQLTLSLTPQTSTQSLTPITLLPTFRGFGGLGGAAVRLLPAVLDSLVTQLDTAGGSSLLRPALSVAAALKLYPIVAASLPLPSDGFATNGDTLTALATTGLSGLEADAGTAAATALANLLGQPRLSAVVPGSVSAANGLVTWTISAAAPAPGIVVSAGWTTATPPALTVSIGVAGLDAGPTTAVVGAQVTLGEQADPDFALDARLTVDVDTTALIGFVLAPTLHVYLDDSGRLAVDLLPLTDAQDPVVSSAQPPGDQPLVISLSPTLQVTGQPRHLISAWIEPAAAQLALLALTKANVLTRTPWPKAPTIQTLLTNSGLLNSSSGTPVAVLPTAPGDLLRDTLRAISAAPPVQVTPDIALSVVPHGDLYGLGLTDTNGITFGSDVEVTLHLTPPNGWPGSGALATSALYVVTVDAGPPPSVSVTPRLDLTIGATVSRAGDAALLDAGVITLGSVSTYLHGALDTTASVKLEQLAGRVELKKFGVPLLSQDSSNTMASQLLGTGSDNGDATTAAATTDLEVYTQPGAGEVHVSLAGTDATPTPTWLPVHRTMGPIYLDQVGIRYDDMYLSLLVDGTVAIAVLTATLDGLGITLPLTMASDLSKWKVDLSGIDVAIQTSGVDIEGGLLKVTGANGVEYDGSLRVEVGGRGISAIGAYSKTQDYTSLFVFATTDFPLGGPPFFFVEALAGGVGVNRSLLVPSDPMQVPTFPLVAELSDTTSPTTLQDKLTSLSTSMPAQRGSNWLAAGLRFSTFALLHTVAVAYVELSGSTLDVGVLGVCSLIQPDAEQPLVNLQLALDARFSTSDDVLSLRAQLTNNSWVLSKDCQLSGGFALIIDFRTPAFLLTLGGYRSGFTSTDIVLPQVPRVGFHWAVNDNIVVKGETYFALVSNCVMWGGQLDVTFQAGPLKAWFSAWTDAFIHWEPFNLTASAGVTIGLSLDISTTFLGIPISTTLTATVGVEVDIQGMPIYAQVTGQIGPAKATITIGSTPATTLENPSWVDFLTGHLPAQPTLLSIGAGMAAREDIADNGTNASPATPDGITNPYYVAPVFSIRLATALPASQFTVDAPGVSSATYTPDSAPPPLSPPVAGDPVLTISQTVTITATGTIPGTLSGTVDVAVATGGFAVALWLGFDGSKARTELLIAGSGLEIAFGGQLGPAVTPDISIAAEFVETSDTSVALAAPSTSSVAAARPRATPTRATSTAVDRPRLLATLRPAAAHVTKAGMLHTPRLTRHGGAARPSPSESSPTALLVDTVDVGATRVWALDSFDERPLTLTTAGTGAVRVVCLATGGPVLADIEGRADALELTVPRGTRRLAVVALGGDRVKVASTVGPGGTVTARHAPHGTAAITGWTADGEVVQVAPQTALCRGAIVSVPVPALTTRQRLQSCQIRRAIEFLGVQRSVCTTLLGGPATIAVIIDDRADPEAISIAALRARLAPPLPAASLAHGRGECRLYELTASDATLDLIVTAPAGTLGGVLRLPGPIGRWGRRPVPAPPPSAPLTGRNPVAITVTAGRRRRTPRPTRQRAT
jgi:hypothetical protein